MMLVHELSHNGIPSDIAIRDHGRQFTYQELTDSIASCRNYLYEAGVRLGDRVGIFSKNNAEYIFAYMAIVSLGAIAVPINFQLSSRETAFILKDAGIRHLITHKTLDLGKSLASLGCNAEITQHDITGIISSTAKPAPSLPEDFDENKPAVIIYTSGTTGSPKGAMLSHKNLICNADQMLDVLNGKRTHRILCVLPMYHCFGWTCSVLYPLLRGARIVILDAFVPKETIETIRSEKITDLYVVPSICSLLTRTASPEDLSSIRLVISGGTTLPLKIEEDFAKKFGLSISEGYGLSEASPVVCFNPIGKNKNGSIGKSLKNIEWRLVDTEGNDVPLGEAGEFIVKGPNVMLGYWNQPEATSNTLRDGWLHTGDVAKADEEGYVYIVDRIKDMIISMGENIYPREVEELIYQFPGIKEAAVIGIPDKLRGQAGACFYALQENAECDVHELKKFLQNNLALYKVPREFHNLPALPRTTTGKIAKRILLEEFTKKQKES